MCLTFYVFFWVMMTKMVKVSNKATVKSWVLSNTQHKYIYIKQTLYCILLVVKRQFYGINSGNLAKTPGIYDFTQSWSYCYDITLFVKQLSF